MTGYRFRNTARDGAIIVVIHQEGTTLYLAPKPGNERVRNKRTLFLVALNLTTNRRDVDVEFRHPIDGTTTRVYVLRNVGSGRAKHRAVKVSVVFPPLVNAIVVPYVVRVGGAVIDPDLKIER